MAAPDLDEAIAQVEAAGLTVVIPRSSPDDQLTDMWLDILKRLRMASDIAKDGGRLRLNHPSWIGATADIAELDHAAAVRMLNAIFANAVVERRDET